MSRTHCRLRTDRRWWGFKQKEIAALLGWRSATHVSRIERAKRPPTLLVALACELLFGRSPRDMFSPIYEKAEERLMRRVYVMHQRLAKSGTAADARKRELLEACLKRTVLSIKKK